MLVGITNTPRDYAWGSSSAIAEVLGRRPSGGREAELWFGDHPLSPSRIVEPSSVGGHATLDAWIAANPGATLGPDRRTNRLPFLLKLLAAETSLSLQAHPSIEQARAGFARESAAGIPLDAPDRTYKDELHKPELTVALSETFEALAGFRDVSRTRVMVAQLLAWATAKGDNGAALLAALQDRLAGRPEAVLRDVVGWALANSDEVGQLVAALGRIAGEAAKSSTFPRELATVAELCALRPGDPGVVVALLLNRVTLTKGEALYLPSGNIHSYQRGLAMEIMAASDNVLRGGLTEKHIDADELQEVVSFQPLQSPRVEPEDAGPGVEVFRPDVPDFVLARMAAGDAHSSGGALSATWTPPGAAIALALGGPATLTGTRSQASIGAGEAVFITAEEGALTVTGPAAVFVASGR